MSSTRTTRTTRALAARAECFGAIAALYLLRDQFLPSATGDIAVVLKNLHDRLQFWEDQLPQGEWRYTEAGRGWTAEFTRSAAGAWVVDVQEKAAEA